MEFLTKSNRVHPAYATVVTLDIKWNQVSFLSEGFLSKLLESRRKLGVHAYQIA